NTAAGSQAQVRTIRFGSRGRRNAYLGPAREVARLAAKLDSRPNIHIAATSADSAAADGPTAWADHVAVTELADRTFRQIKRVTSPNRVVIRMAAYDGSGLTPDVARAANIRGFPVRVVGGMANLRYEIETSDGATHTIDVPCTNFQRPYRSKYPN